MEFTKIEETFSRYLDLPPQRNTNAQKELNKNKISIKKRKDSTSYIKIEYFRDYLLKELHIVDLNKLETLGLNDLKEAMKYYIDETRKRENGLHHVKTISAFMSFVTSVKEYFLFLHENGIRNQKVVKSFSLPANDSESLERVVNEVIEERTLRVKISKQMLSEEEFIKLNKECNEKIEELYEYLIKTDFEKQDYKNYDYTGFINKYKNFVSGVIIKLILYTGIKCQALKNIKFSHLNLYNNNITINGFVIDLHPNLKIYLEMYDLIRKKVCQMCSSKDKKVSDNLFIWLDGTTKYLNSNNNLKSIFENTFIAPFLRNSIDRWDITGINKFIIMQMLKKGISENVIMEFTCATDDIFKDCLKKYINNKSIYMKQHMMVLHATDIFKF